MILFSDFDDTFYFRDNDEKTDANFEAVKKWRTLNNKFSITTGRSYKSVTEEFPRIKELCDYYIVDSGSIILSGVGELLHAFYLESELVSNITKFSEGFFEKPVIIYYTLNSEDTLYKAENVTKLRFWFEDVSHLEEMTAKIADNFEVFATYNEDARSSHPELREKHGFIEVVSKESGKNNAIKFLQQKEGILPSEILTVGDSANDYAMIRDFGGFAIEGSELSSTHGELKATPSLVELLSD